MTTLDDYIADQRARKAEYQRQYRARAKASVGGAEGIRAKNAEYQRQYRERLKTRPEALERARAKNAEYQRRYRDRLAEQRLAEIRARTEAHAALILRYCAAHPGVTTAQAATALHIAIEDHTAALRYLSEMLK